MSEKHVFISDKEKGPKPLDSLGWDTLSMYRHQLSSLTSTFMMCPPLRLISCLSPYCTLLFSLYSSSILIIAHI